MGNIVRRRIVIKTGIIIPMPSKLMEQLGEIGQRVEAKAEF